MSSTKFALGLDFGTESGRALLVDVATGHEVASAVHRYGDGVIDEKLPGTSIRLEPDWALQNPADYIETLRHAVPDALKLAGARAEDVIGIGVDFTACTILPTLADGTPLCFTDRWKGNPHAWVKLWKHHAAQPEADRITALAQERGEPWLERYGGRISSEWLHSKTLQILDEAPEVYAAADRIVEAGDWIVWQMTGVETRNSCAAGCKGLWERSSAYPGKEFLHALDPRLADLNRTKLRADVVSIGSLAGRLTAQAAAWMGLREGTAVAAATIDAHAAVPGAGVAEPGGMVLILGTSTCHMLVDRKQHIVPGISGVVADSIIPGLFGYEAGQAGVGDIFEWFVENAVPSGYSQLAAQRGISVYDLLQEEASGQIPGESGLLALDWWNGNRSVLVDANLSGLLIGATLGTSPPDIFRALIEATAFGTKIIIDTFEANGVAVNELVAAGGLAARNKLLLQIYADVTGREFREAGSEMASALGAAMFGAVAAGREEGGYDSIADAAHSMASYRDRSYRPDARNTSIYREIFTEYRKLHDYFGRGGNDVMKRLRELRAGARSLQEAKADTV
jgi:L-ribulokinase